MFGTGAFPIAGGLAGVGASGGACGDETAPDDWSRSADFSGEFYALKLSDAGVAQRKARPKARQHK